MPQTSSVNKRRKLRLENYGSTAQIEVVPVSALSHGVLARGCHNSCESNVFAIDAPLESDRVQISNLLRELVLPWPDGDAKVPQYWKAREQTCHIQMLLNPNHLHATWTLPRPIALWMTSAFSCSAIAASPCNCAGSSKPCLGAMLAKAQRVRINNLSIRLAKATGKI